MFGAGLDGLLRLGAFVIMALCVTTPLWAADPERAQLAEARQRIEADHAQREAQCRQQFVVTSCVEAAQAVRREGLAALQAREAEIDDRERKQRASDRQSRIDAKQQRLKAVPTPVPFVPADAGAQPARVDNARSLSDLRPQRPSASRGDTSSARPVKPKPQAKPRSRPVDTQDEAARFDARQQEARSRKAAAVARQKERERSGAPPRAPLPPVGGALPSPPAKTEAVR